MDDAVRLVQLFAQIRGWCSRLGTGRSLTKRRLWRWRRVGRLGECRAGDERAPCATNRQSRELMAIMVLKLADVPSVPCGR